MEDNEVTSETEYEPPSKKHRVAEASHDVDAQSEDSGNEEEDESSTSEMNETGELEDNMAYQEWLEMAMTATEESRNEKCKKYISNGMSEDDAKEKAHDGLGIESINVDENTPTYISVSWSTDAGSSWDHYMVDIVPPSGYSLNGYPINTTDTSYQITGLSPEEEYTITVKPWSSGSAGDAANTTVFTEAIAEGEILVSDVTSSSAYIQWRAVEGVIFYTIVTEPSDAIGHLGGILEEEVGLTILLPGTVFNVTLQNGQTFSSLASTEIRSAPGSPVNVTLDQIGSTEATISWTPPTTPRDAYEVYVINNSTNERLLAATIRPEEVNECTVNGLSRAWVYRFEVGTLLDASNSFALQRSDMNSNPSVLGRTGPEAPLGVFVSSITDVSVSLTLTPPSSPHDGYELYKLNPTDNHRTLVSNLTRENGMIYETDIVGLVPATLYYVEVGTFLNAEGSFPLQMSEEYAAVTFQTELQMVIAVVGLISGVLAVDGAVNSAGQPGDDPVEGEIHFVALFPGGTWEGLEIAGRMAVDDINSNPNILKNYTLVMHVDYTNPTSPNKPNQGLAASAFYQRLYNGPPKSFLIGGFYSEDSGILCETVKYWNVIQVSYIFS
ncbi:fibronectin-like [Lytechinus pictus]|uniref:fibronectin-like n=1 Tax=Lytechinus pictus TaxID=7653 RepID=UPI0030B9EDBA